MTYAEHPVVKGLQADLCQETQASRFKAAGYCGHSTFSVEVIEECCIADPADPDTDFILHELNTD